MLFFLIWCMCTFNSTLKYQSVLYKLTLQWMISYTSAIQVPNCSWIKTFSFSICPWHVLFISLFVWMSALKIFYFFKNIKSSACYTEIFKQSQCPWKKNSDELLSKLLNWAYINGCRHQRINELMPHCKGEMLNIFMEVD